MKRVLSIPYDIVVRLVLRQMAHSMRLIDRLALIASQSGLWRLGIMLTAMTCLNLTACFPVQPAVMVIRHIPSAATGGSGCLGLLFMLGLTLSCCSLFGPRACYRFWNPNDLDPYWWRTTPTSSSQPAMPSRQASIAASGLPETTTSGYTGAQDLYIPIELVDAGIEVDIPGATDLIESSNELDIADSKQQVEPIFDSATNAQIGVAMPESHDIPQGAGNAQLDVIRRGAGKAQFDDIQHGAGKAQFDDIQRGPDKDKAN